MSQPQPAPYSPTQPAKKSSTGTIIVVVVVVVALVAGLGAYGAYRLFQNSDLPNGGGSSIHTIDIFRNFLTETVPINTNFTVDMSCNYCTITLHLSDSNVRADLDLL